MIVQPNLVAFSTLSVGQTFELDQFAPGEVCIKVNPLPETPITAVRLSDGAQLALGDTMVRPTVYKAVVA